MKPGDTTWPDGIELAVTRQSLPHPDDPARRHGHIGPAAGGPGAVDHRPPRMTISPSHGRPPLGPPIVAELGARCTPVPPLHRGRAPGRPPALAFWAEMPAPADPLQTSGALVPETSATSAVPPGATRLVGLPTRPLRIARAQYRRRVRRTPEIRMVPGSVAVGDRQLRFAVSDNEGAHGPGGPGSPPVWAVNIHGYFAGGGMYWRESARVAERLGWRIVNPSLPGFGGSDPLPWSGISIPSLAAQVGRIMAHLDAPPAVLIGHSMGGAVAVQYATDHPEHTLGLIYRSGIATPAWKERHGLLPTLLGPVLPDVAPLADLMAAVVLTPRTCWWDGCTRPCAPCSPT